LAAGDARAFKAARQKAADSGKTKISTNSGDKNKNNSAEMANAKLIARAREVIVTIVENLDIVVKGTNSNNINTAFQIIDENLEHQQAITDEFGVEFGLIKDLFETGVINLDLIELQVDS
jgi:hypothetical protein